MSLYYLSLGSNIQPEKYIPLCIRALKEHFTVEACSSIYETPPIGPAGKDNFWNAVVAIETELDKENLVIKLRALETNLDRVRSGKNKFEPRTIDIDILPQPQFQHLSFIIIPLAEIAPETMDKETGKSYRKLAEKSMQEVKGMRKINSDEAVV